MQMNKTIHPNKNSKQTKTPTKSPTATKHQNQPDKTPTKTPTQNKSKQPKPESKIYMKKGCSAFLDGMSQCYCFSLCILREKMRSAIQTGYTC